MLDIKYVRENQEAVAEAMKNRNASWDAERFSSLHAKRRRERSETSVILSNMLDKFPCILFSILDK